MRTRSEVLQRYKERQEEGRFFDFYNEVLLGYLTGYLTVENVKPLDHDSIRQEAKEYMEFAWGKVIDHRGISANRSINKMEAWCWLLEVEPGTIDFDNFPMYGAPILKQICLHFGWPMPDDSDAIAMANGEACDSCQADPDGGCRT
jgi:hypothetical protein